MHRSTLAGSNMALPIVGRIDALCIASCWDPCQASALLEELLARCRVFFVVEFFESEWT